MRNGVIKSIIRINKTKFNLAKQKLDRKGETGVSETEEKRKEKRKDEENKVTISIVSKHKSLEILENIYVEQIS